MDGLKPCPFCGGEAILNELEAHTHVTPFASFMPNYEGGVFVECTSCTVALSARTRQEAIEDWNNRVE